MNLIYQSPKNQNSHLTLKERDAPSFPCKRLMQMRLISGRVLDFGCGSGIDVTFMKSNGFDVLGYDPHYFPIPPAGQFDTILCTYVLNVLLPDEQVQVIMAISELLKPGGKAFITVRRDVIKNGYRIHAKHLVEVYQCNVILPYKSLLRTDSCEIYEYQHINQLVTNSKVGCSFCYPDSTWELITESASAYAILDKKQISHGHTLIVPKKHQENYFILSEHSKTASIIVMDRAKLILDQRYNPDGYNVGINIGKAAGQNSNHAIIHLIPRFFTK